MAPRTWLAPTLLTVMTITVLEAMRFSGPLFSVAYEQASSPIVASLAFLAAAIPAAVLALTAKAGRLLRAAGISVVLYVITHASLQLASGGLYPGGLLLITTALTSWVLCVATVRRAFDARTVVVTILFGTALAIAWQLLVGTWDIAWRNDFPALIIMTFALMALFLLGAFAITKQAATAEDGGTRVRLRDLWPLGAWLTVAVMVFANPAFLASQSHIALGWSGAIALVAVAIGVSLLDPQEAQSDVPLLAPAGKSRQRTIIASVGFIGGVVVGFAVSGFIAIIAIFIALLASIPLLLDVLERPTGADDEPGSTIPSVFTLTVATLVIAAIPMVTLTLYHLNYHLNLTIPHFVIAGVLAALLPVSALVAVWNKTPAADDDADTTTPTHPVTVEKVGGGALLLIALFAGLMAPTIPSNDDVADATESEEPTSLRVMSWNLHFSVSDAPRIPLDEVLATVEKAEPDVLLLQEVSRGWLRGGGTDTLTWLASATEMTAAWEPGTDNQFGNAILAKYPLTDQQGTQLAKSVTGTSRQSLIEATIESPHGDIRAASTQILHRGNDSDVDTTRALNDALASDVLDGNVVLGGAFDAGAADSDEITEMLDAGWTSAIDKAGTEEDTYPAPDPDQRADWLFFGPGLTPDAATVLEDATGSVHLPILAEFELGAGE